MKAFTYNKDLWKRAINEDYAIDEPASLETYESAVLLPPRYISGTRKQYGDGILEGGVTDSSGAFVAGLRRSNGPEDVNKNCSTAYAVNSDEVEECHESVIFGGILTSHFGHMICDGITRLWYCALNPHDTRRVAVLVMPGQVFK